MRTLVIVGHGMVGHRLVARVRAGDPAGDWRIVVLTEEPHHAYDRVRMSSYLDGVPVEELSLVTPELRTDPLVRIRTGTRVTEVTPQRRTVRTGTGELIRYDALVLATGAGPVLPPVPGADLPRCFGYRTIADLDAIRAAVVPGRPAVVVGGGLLGLEAADALRRLGMRPYVVELAPHLLPMQVDPGCGVVLHRLATDLGLRVRCGVPIVAVEPGGTRYRVRLADGTVLPAGVVVFAAGVRPRDGLGADLPRAARGGYLVDGLCRTGTDGVWAVGDCAAPHGDSHPLVEPGYRMADCVADQLLGRPATALTTVDLSTRLKVLGLDVASFGDAHARTPDAIQLSYRDCPPGSYARLVLDAGARVLLGGVLVGRTAAFGQLRALVGTELPAPPEVLLGSG